MEVRAFPIPTSLRNYLCLEYFEDTSMSGGGDIVAARLEVVQLNGHEHASFILTFKNIEDARHVVRRGKHKIPTSHDENAPTTEVHVKWSDEDTLREPDENYCCCCQSHAPVNSVDYPQVVCPSEGSAAKREFLGSLQCILATERELKKWQIYFEDNGQIACKLQLGCYAETEPVLLTTMASADCESSIQGYEFSTVNTGNKEQRLILGSSSKGNVRSDCTQSDDEDIDTRTLKSAVNSDVNVDCLPEVVVERYKNDQLTEASTLQGIQKEFTKRESPFAFEIDVGRDLSASGQAPETRTSDIDKPEEMTEIEAMELEAEVSDGSQYSALSPKAAENFRFDEHWPDRAEKELNANLSSQDTDDLPVLFGNLDTASLTMFDSSMDTDHDHEDSIMPKQMNKHSNHKEDRVNQKDFLPTKQFAEQCLDLVCQIEVPSLQNILLDRTAEDGSQFVENDDSFLQSEMDLSYETASSLSESMKHALEGSKIEQTRKSNEWTSDKCNDNVQGEKNITEIQSCLPKQDELMSESLVQRNESDISFSQKVPSFITNVLPAVDGEQENVNMMQGADKNESKYDIMLQLLLDEANSSETHLAGSPSETTEDTVKTKDILSETEVLMTNPKVPRDDENSIKEYQFSAVNIESNEQSDISSFCYETKFSTEKTESTKKDIDTRTLKSPVNSDFSVDYLHKVEEPHENDQLREGSSFSGIHIDLSESESLLAPEVDGWRDMSASGGQAPETKTADINNSEEMTEIEEMGLEALAPGSIQNSSSSPKPWSIFAFNPPNGSKKEQNAEWSFVVTDDLPVPSHDRYEASLVKFDSPMDLHRNQGGLVMTEQMNNHSNYDSKRVSQKYLPYSNQSDEECLESACEIEVPLLQNILCDRTAEVGTESDGSLMMPAPSESMKHALEGSEIIETSTSDDYMSDTCSDSILEVKNITEIPPCHPKWAEPMSKCFVQGKQKYLSNTMKMSSLTTDVLPTFDCVEDHVNIVQGNDETHSEYDDVMLALVREAHTLQHLDSASAENAGMQHEFSVDEISAALSSIDQRLSKITESDRDSG